MVQLHQREFYIRVIESLRGPADVPENEETAPLRPLLLGCGMVYLIISGSAPLLESLNEIYIFFFFLLWRLSIHECGISGEIGFYQLPH